MECREDSYKRIYQLIEGCVNKVTYREISQCKKILVVAINEETRFKNFLESLEKENPSIELIIVAQESMVERMISEYYEKYKILAWNGKYTLDVLEEVDERYRISDVEGFVFFTDLSINLRDMNFMNMAEVLQSRRVVNIYCSTVSGELFEYKNVSVYIQAIKVYQDINDLIDKYFS